MHAGVIDDFDICLAFPAEVHVGAPARLKVSIYSGIWHEMMMVAGKCSEYAVRLKVIQLKGNLSDDLGLAFPGSYQAYDGCAKLPECRSLLVGHPTQLV